MSKTVKLFAGASDKTIVMIAVINIMLAAAALVRDILLALSLGTTADADAFVLAFSVPDIFANNIFAVSAAMAAVPMLTEVLMNKGKTGFEKTSRTLLLSVFAASVVIFTTGMIFRDGIISILGSGFDEHTALLASRLLMIMMPAALFFPLYTFGASVHNVKGSFLIPAAAPVMFNLVYIAGITAGMLMYRDSGKLVTTISFFVVTGVATMAVMVWAGRIKKAAADHENMETVSYAPVRKDIKEYLRLLFPYLFVYSACQSVLFAERYFASALEVGTISGLNYAYRISQLPTWVFIAALGTYALPSLSRLNGKDSKTAQSDSIIRHLKTTFLICMPFSAAIFFLRRPIVEVLLSRGAFDAASGQITSGILAGYALAITGQGIIFICLRFFLSMRYVKYPAAAVILASALNIAADAVLVKTSGYAGLGIGAAIGGTFGGAILMILINRKTNGLVKRNMTSFVKITAASLVMVPFAAGSGYIWPDLPLSDDPWIRFVYLCIAFIILSLIYIGGLKIFRYRNDGGDPHRKE